MRSSALIGSALAASLALLCAPLAGSSPAADGTLSGSVGTPGGAYIKFTITGADLRVKTRSAERLDYVGTSASPEITLSGTVSFTPTGFDQSVSMSAHVGDQDWEWPCCGLAVPPVKVVAGQTVSKSFRLTFKRSSKPYETYISAGIGLHAYSGVGVSFVITFKKPAAVPVVQAYPVRTVYRPGTDVRMPLSVKDESGKARVHGTLYEGGKALRGLRTRTFVTADGRKYDWVTHLTPDRTGPLFFCVWAENPAGEKSAGAPKSSCAWLSLLVDIAPVSNHCGGQGWDSVVAIENKFGNTSSYYDLDQDETYTVDFSDACDLHDAGYGGYMVADKINGGIPNFRTYSREEVDVKFQKDMQAICIAKIPPAARRARAECLAGDTRFTIVRTIGYKFFDADLTKPGLQQTGPRDNS